jgi:hypothetical protein
MLPEIGAHSLEYFGQNRGSGVIVQIDAVHMYILRELRGLRRRDEMGVPTSYL